ncbi:MAG: hypothetical protein PUB18_04130, partial [bacterium]|nr:hypothetical protein [bacterium]
MEDYNKQAYTNKKGPVWVKAIDAQGNTSNILSYNIKTDSKGPTFTVSSNSNEITSDNHIIAYISDVRDGDGVGIDETNAYSFDRGKSWGSEKQTKYALSQAGSDHVVYVKDKLGNQSELPVQIIMACSGSGGTADPSDVVAGKTFWKDGQLIEGTLTVVSEKEIIETITPGDTQIEYVLQPGIYKEVVKIHIQPSVCDTTGDATPSDIIAGKVAWVNGQRLVGTLSDRSGQPIEITPECVGDKCSIPGEVPVPPGCYDDNSIISNKLEGTATPNKILAGYTAWVYNETTGKNEKITGTLKSFSGDQSDSTTGDPTADSTSGGKLTISTQNPNPEFNIKEGFHDGTGKVTVDLEDTTATTAEMILAGQTVWISNGSTNTKITGTMENHESIDGNVAKENGGGLILPNQTFDIQPGLYTGGSVKVTLGDNPGLLLGNSDRMNGGFKSEYLLKGNFAWGRASDLDGQNVLIEGTMENRGTFNRAI